MKKIYFLFFFCSCLSLNGQNLKLTKVKINAQDAYPIKGYLFDVDNDKVILVPKKKWVKKFLLAQNCENCYTVPREIIWDLTFSQKKPFQPIGLMAGASLGLLLTSIADTTPNPDGLNGKDIAKIYAGMGTFVGGIIDLLRLPNHLLNKRNVDNNNFELPNILLAKSAIYQFNKIRKKQLEKLSSILTKIEKKKTSHRKPINIYTKDKKIVSGYIIGQKDGKLLLGIDKKKVIEYRNNPPDGLNEISLEDIFYYDFGKR